MRLDLIASCSRLWGEGGVAHLIRFFNERQPQTRGGLAGPGVKGSARPASFRGCPKLPAGREFGREFFEIRADCRRRLRAGAEAWGPDIGAQIIDWSIGRHLDKKRHNVLFSTYFSANQFCESQARRLIARRPR